LGRGGVRGPAAAVGAFVLERLPEGVHGGSEVTELLEMLLAEAFELLCAAGGEPEADDAVVLGVLGALEQPGRDGPVDEADGAVMPEEQVVGDVSDGRSGRVVMTSDREQELMLGGGEASRVGVLLAPAQEAPQIRAQLQQTAVVLVGRAGRHRGTFLRPGFAEGQEPG
jgi:hypothetical protein